MTAPLPIQQPKPKSGTSRSRQPPYPNSILDRQTLITALDDAGLTIKAAHIDTFYQALHRQHYPDLKQFVANYYVNEAESAARSQAPYQRKQQNRQSQKSHHQQQQQPQQHEVVSAQPQSYTSAAVEWQSPLKNPVSTKKNRNLQQLPKVLLDFLSSTDTLVTLTSTVAQATTSADGSTTKLAIQLHDGQLVETVLMRYNNNQYQNQNANTSTQTSRASLCVSSQCGCAMGCTFCATGTMGLSGSLTAGEILEQIVHADHILAREWRAQAAQAIPQQRQHLLQDKAASDRQQQRNDQNDDYKGKENTTTTAMTASSSLDKLDLVRNVVFMGMGEPLDNYVPVVAACRALIDRRRWNLAHGRVTVSTVGLVAKIRRLTQELPEVSLAVSLHAPNQAMRSAIVPSAKHYPIEDLIEALDGHMMAYLTSKRQSRLPEAQNESKSNDDQGLFTAAERIKESTRRRAMIEYVMLVGDTSTLECAHELGKLCENRQLVVNLIPYNQTDVKDKLRCPSEKHMKEFQNIVASYGSFCTIRRTMGADIDSACGQLITLRKKKEAEKVGSIADAGDAVAVVVGDIEDVPSNKVGKEKTVFSRVVAVVGGSSSSSTTGDNVDDFASSTDKPDMEKWIRPLTRAMAVAASCFLVSSVLFLRQKRR